MGVHIPVNPPAGNMTVNCEVVSLAKRRILVVDDTRAAAFMLGRLLESLGQEVSLCYDAESALRMATTCCPEIIFSDIVMPNVDGYQLAQQIRAEENFRNVMLVALTGYDHESDRHQAYAAGFNHHIVKPVTLQALRSLLQ
jgi:CheY-like chemotaxis protein